MQFAVYDSTILTSTTVYSNGNLTAAATGSGYVYTNSIGNVSKTSGKWYCEFTLNADYAFCGIADSVFRTYIINANVGDYLGDNPNSAGWFSHGGLFYYYFAMNNYFSVGAYPVDTIIGVALDIDNLLLHMYKNGVEQLAGGLLPLALPSGKSWYFANAMPKTGGQVTVNAGASAWAYTPPVGFTGWTPNAVPEYFSGSSRSYSYARANLTVSHITPPPNPILPNPTVFEVDYQQETIPSYLYLQYNDDQNLQAFVRNYNTMTQLYVDWFNQNTLANYPALTGSLLDWVGTGLYGFTRPTLESPSSQTTGPLDTFMLDNLVIDGGVLGGGSVYQLATDDIYQRCLTWHFLKSDERSFTILWLKRRVRQFLYGSSGSPINLAGTDNISLTIAGSTVTINLTAVADVPSGIIDAFQYAIEGGILELPPQYTYTVTT
ncbi:MAG: hypothetical protein ACRESI_06440 [Gammaproteobacteria bacterium]